MKYADQLVDEYLASLRKDISEKHFGIKINLISKITQPSILDASKLG
jgi:hypothetical protein